ncbi:MAG: molybdenum cofactor biosynthesis protein MoaE [Verrucomicrobia bacterium]|nr:molybdenum cofactor biosynthesis protein MoaE [Verrucomicrobiota bacterium]
MIEADLTHSPITQKTWTLTQDPGAGALAEFRGVVRGLENSAPIRALRYTAYEKMAVSEILRIAGELAEKYQIRTAQITHRLGEIPVGETSILVAASSAHRAGAFAFLADFMDQMKKDVPIWKEPVA